MGICTEGPGVKPWYGAFVFGRGMAFLASTTEYRVLNYFYRVHEVLYPMPMT